MNDVPVKAPAEWRNFGTRFPITACHLKREDLKVLYRIISDRQVEYRDKIVALAWRSWFPNSMASLHPPNYHEAAL